MRLMLTSFGAARPGTLTRPGDMFYRMPPVDMTGGGFRPPFHALLLCERLTVDSRTFGALQEHRRHPAYDAMASTMNVLHGAGLLDLVDYDEILDDHAGLLDEMTAGDLAHGLDWTRAMLDSTTVWRSFVRRAGTGSRAEREAEMLDQPRPRAWSPDGLPGHARIMDAVADYLAYVNANLVLSAALDAPILDWADFAPFYRDKFRHVGHPDAPGSRQTRASESLFTIAFPDFRIDDPHALLRILRHRHVAELRGLIEAAAEGREDFDGEFANRTLREIADREQALGRYRKVAGYATAPLGLLPGIGNLAQLAVQEAVDVVVSRRLRRDYRWFYLLTDVARSS